jgi:uncharacterized protein (TIGR00266 family)
MQTEILYPTANALARVTLAPRETIRVESGAMVSMSADMEIQTGTQGGFLKALKRSALGGESFFMNTFTASDHGGEITLAPSLPGDMLVLELNNSDYKVQAGGYIASAQGITIDTKWGGSRSFFGGDANFFMLQATGSGQLLIASYGALHKMTLAAGQRYSVDTGHVVAFPSSMGFNVRRIGGLKSTIFSGEGFVVDLTGPGDLFLQTRSQPALIAWLSNNLPGSSEAR